MTQANRVKETSTTTGTGDKTLAGAVTAFNSFSSQYADGDLFTYWIVSDSDQWQTGVGHLTTGDLVSDQVFENSLGTTAEINFTGTLDIFISDSKEAGWSAPYVSSFLDAGKGAKLDSMTGGAGFDTLAQYEGAIFVPAFNFTGRVVSSLGTDIRVSDAGDTNTRIALFKLADDGKPGLLIASTAALAATATFGLFGSVTTFYLPPGPLYGAVLTESATVQFGGVGLLSRTASFPGSECCRSQSNTWGVDNATSFSDNPAVIVRNSTVITHVPDVRTG